MKASGVSVSSSFMARFFFASRSRRSRMWRDVTHLPLLPAKGEVLTWKRTLMVGSSTLMRGRASCAVGGGDGVADLHVVEAGEQHDVARARLLDGRALHAAHAVHDVDALLLRGRLADARDLVVDAHLAATDATDGEAADVLVVLHVGHQHLQRAIHVARRRRDALDDGLEQGRERGALVGQVELGDAVLGDRVDGGEVELVLVRLELTEQVEGLGEHLVGARVGAVDLVDDHDHRDAELERLARARSASGAADPRPRRPAEARRRPW